MCPLLDTWESRVTGGENGRGPASPETSRTAVHPKVIAFFYDPLSVGTKHRPICQSNRKPSKRKHTTRELRDESYLRRAVVLVMGPKYAICFSNKLNINNYNSLNQHLVQQSIGLIMSGNAIDLPFKNTDFNFWQPLD